MNINKHMDRMKSDTISATKLLKKNLSAPIIPGVIIEGNYSNKHLLTIEQGWEPPNPNLVRKYFSHFKENTEFNTDEKLAALLGISSNRRIREFSSGNRPIGYELWRKFLIMTGRVVNDVVPTIFITTP